LIHVAAEKAKTRARRLVPILDNLGEWLAPYSAKEGLIFKGTGTEYVNAKATTVTKAKIPWKPNALRHSFISYRLADIQDVAQVALEAGNSPETIFAHYRELVKPEAAKTWFTIGPETPANVVTLKAAVAAKP
jgi:integrase